MIVHRDGPYFVAILAYEVCWPPSSPESVSQSNVNVCLVRGQGGALPRARNMRVRVGAGDRPSVGCGVHVVTPGWNVHSLCTLERGGSCLVLRKYVNMDVSSFISVLHS